MSQDEIDLERAINDPDYRRLVLRWLNGDGDAQTSEHDGGTSAGSREEGRPRGGARRR